MTFLQFFIYTFMGSLQSFKSQDDLLLNTAKSNFSVKLPLGYFEVELYPILTVKVIKL